MRRTPANERSGAPVFFRRIDWLAVGLLLLVAAGLLFAGLTRRGGTVALVSVAGEADIAQTIVLSRNGLHRVRGELPVTLEVRDGAIRFVNSLCPDHTCEDFGWLSHEGDSALCAPAGVMVWVEERR